MRGFFRGAGREAGRHEHEGGCRNGAGRGWGHGPQGSGGGARHGFGGDQGGFGGERGGGRRDGGFGGGFGGGGFGGRGGARVFGHGGLRLVLLRLIADKPAHGYELIKQIEEKFGGAYSPSPGVVYPTLTLLEEMGLATVSAEEGGRKLYTITDAGRAHLAEHRALVDEMLARMNGAAERGAQPAQVVRALENFKLAVRLRLARGPLSEEQASAFAAALDAAAQQVERI